MNSRSIRYAVTPGYQDLALWLSVLIALASWCGHAIGQGEWRPSRNVELVVQAGAGGASDRTAGTMQKIMQDKRLIDSPTTVINKAGGGSALAYAYLNQHAGDAH